MKFWMGGGLGVSSIGVIAQASGVPPSGDVSIWLLVTVVGALTSVATLLYRTMQAQVNKLEARNEALLSELLANSRQRGDASTDTIHSTAEALVEAIEGNKKGR